MLSIKGIYVELTTECNLRCKHCYNDSGESNSIITLDNMYNILYYINKLNIKQITLSGGEPLTHPLIIEILRVLTVENNIGVTIVSNAILITQEFVNNLKQNCNVGNLIFQISVDGSNSEEHDYIRGTGSFLQMVNGINVLRNNDIRFYFHSLIHKQNYKSLVNMVEFALQYNVGRLEFTFLKKKGRGDWNYNYVTIPVDKQLELIDYLEDLKKNNSQLLDMGIPSVFFGVCPFITDDNDFDVFIRIDSYGNVYPCQNIGIEKLSLGNINNSLLSDIVTINNMVDLRYRIKNILVKKQNKCVRCLVLKNCGRGCPGVECMDNYFEYSDECEQRRLLCKKRISSFINNCDRI